MAIRTRSELIQDALEISNATDPNEISALQTGTLFENIIDSSLQSSDLAFDGNRTITAPEFENIMASGSTVQEFLESVFFPAQAPVATLSGGGNREFGDAGTPAGVLNVTLNVTRQTNPITAIMLAGENVPTNGESEVISRSVPVVLNQDTTITATVIDSASVSTMASTSLQYRHRRFAFTSAADLINATDTEISDALNANLTDSEFSTNRVRTESFLTSSEFIYFAYPAEFGEPTVFVNGLVNNAWLTREFDYTNQFGFTTSYILVASFGVLENTFTVAIG